MATYLLDTSAFSHLVAEDPQFEKRLGMLSPADRIVICPVVRGEIMYGLERMPEGRRKQDLTAKVICLMSVIPCESIPPSAGDHYGRLKRQAEIQGTSLDENDLWIAAIAQALDAVLVSADSDFLRLPQLRVENWFQ